MNHQLAASVQFATTIDYNQSLRFKARSRLINLPKTNRPFPGLRWFFHILVAAWTEDVLLLDNERVPDTHPELFAAAVMGFWPKQRRPIVVLVGDMYQLDSGFRGFIGKLLIKLADKGICLYAVRSSDELKIFPETWGVLASKVRHCPFYYSVPDQEPEPMAPLSGDYVFAGGNSHREYEPLMLAARNLPELKFVIATSRLNNNEAPPPNVTAGPVSHDNFMRLLRSAAAVVVPLRRGLVRAAGQQVYLMSMWLGKPTIVCEAPAVRDQVQDGETGFIVDGSPADYERVLRWVFDSANQDKVARLRAAAHKVVNEQYTFENHVDCLLKILDEAIYKAARIRPNKNRNN
jgi:hypothetical protein